MSRHGSSPGYLPLFAIPVLAYVAILLGVGIAVRPSALGWGGLGVSAAIGLLVAGLAAHFYPRTRANAVRLHPRSGDRFRLLVVVETPIEAARLRARVRSAIGGRRPADVLVVCPVRASALHFLTDAEEPEHERAQSLLERTLEGLEDLRVPVGGSLGTDDPLQAIGDALAAFPADEIVVVEPERGRRTWLERDLEQRARDLYGVHVSALPAVAHG